MRSSGGVERRVRHRGATRDGKLANAVDRVVIVDGQQQPVTRGERIRLTYVLEGTGRVEGEDRDVVVTGVEPVEHRAPRSLDKSRRIGGSGAGRVRIPQQT